MAVTLRIDALTIVTDANRFNYTFTSGINTVTGQVGSGKSSMLELVKYGLGGHGVLTPAVQQGVRRVVVDAVIGVERVTMERELGSRIVRAFEPGGTLLEELATRHSESTRSASGFLLDALGLPELRVTNVKPTKRSAPLSFFDIYAYCYVPQVEIDRSVVNHLETVTRSKRVGAFELLLGLTDEHLSRARVELGVMQDKLAEARRPLDLVDRFLRDAETPSAEQLRRQENDALRRLDHAGLRLQSLRAETLNETAESVELRKRLMSTVRDAATLATRVQELEAEAARRRQLDAELEADLARLSRASAANDVLGDIAFVHCPRCFQGVNPGRFGDDNCYVCGQSDPPAASALDASIDNERRRLEGLRTEIRSLNHSESEELERCFSRQRAVNVIVEEIERQLDAQTRGMVSPRYEAIEEASRDSATASAELTQVERLLKLWEERETYATAVRNIEDQIHDLQREIDLGSTALAQRRSRVRELSDIFDQIIQELDMPWYDRGAYINAKTYLPVVNGVGIEKLGSGGMKMMTNVAYHLALLTYGLSSRIDTIPNLLILDSPRKNLGTTPEDQAHAERFYRWVSALTRTYDDRFQMIIADNDPPTDDTPVSNRIRLSHGDPLIKDLPHPGEGVLTIGS